MRLASLVIHKSSHEIIAKGRRIAAHPARGGGSRHRLPGRPLPRRGTDRSLGLFEIAAAAQNERSCQTTCAARCARSRDETVSYAGFRYGCHVCEVEVDPDTGVLAIVRYITVDDVGRAVNPMIVHGQTHGGIAQGVGQALMEHCFYDAANGQMLSGSFMDYAMPRAHILPLVQDRDQRSARHRPIRSASGRPARAAPRRRSPWWSTPSSMRSPSSASRHIEMPATPERIWRAIRGLPPRSRTDLDATESGYGGSAM